MPRFVLLLRGVNVGKGNRVPMASLRALLEDLGHTEVRTLLNSGNAVFASTSRSSSALAAKIGKALDQELDVRVPVIVKSAAEYAAIVDGNPIVPPEAGHSRFLVAFASDARRLEQLVALRPLVTAKERFVIGEHAAYLHCASGLLESEAATALLGKLGREVTTRNWATVLKLDALVRG